MQKPFYNNIIFRLAAPPLLGVVVYFLVLMFFDSLSMISDNFFSREILFTIGLSYIFLETNRLIIILHDRVFSAQSAVMSRAVSQYFSAFVITVLLVSLVLYMYFIFIVGFSTILTELITFNSIYLFIGFFYHLFFFSLFLISRNNEVRMQQELIKKDNLNMELQAFKNQVNPDFLFRALEIIISELYHEKKHADHLIGALSRTYRFSLDHLFSDLIPLKKEIDSIEPVLEIFKTKYKKTFGLKINGNGYNNSYNVIPGTLKVLIEFALSENLITEYLPLEIAVNVTDDKMTVCYPVNERLNHQNPVQNRLDFLLKTYSNFSGANEYSKMLDGKREFVFPLIEVSEE
jgi:hypothetical protein